MKNTKQFLTSILILGLIISISLNIFQMLHIKKLQSDLITLDSISTGLLNDVKHLNDTIYERELEINYMLNLSNSN